MAHPPVGTLSPPRAKLGSSELAPCSMNLLNSKVLAFPAPAEHHVAPLMLAFCFDFATG